MRRTSGFHRPAGRDRLLLAAAALALAGGAAFGYATLEAITFGLGDKQAVDLGGWLVERRTAYRAGFGIALAGLLALLAGLLLPAGAARAWVRPLFTAALAAAVVVLVVKGEAPAGAAADAAAYTEMPATPYADPARAADLIRARDASAIDSLRGALVARVWSGEGLPVDRAFDAVERDVAEPRLAETGAVRIDRLTLALPYGFTAVGYHMAPAAPSGWLVLYNHGHVGTLFSPQAVEAAARMLAAGHGVIAFSMPMIPPNGTPPVLESPVRGQVANRLAHNGLTVLETEAFSPIRLFVEPLVVAVSHGLAEGYRDIAALGFSGGGWTVTVAAALDARIRASFPVAGSLPMYLLALPPNQFGDWEQTGADIYRIANYPELYVLGAAGEGRWQVQILNQFDGCCFRGVGARGYAPAVAEAAAAAGGRYDLVILPVHEHVIAPQAFDRILADLSGSPS